MAMPPDFLPALTGSLSQGAAGNPTVAMIEAAYAHHGLHWRYVNMEVMPEQLGAAVRGLRAVGFRGFNCGLPHKVTVIAHLDGLALAGAARIDVVNRDAARGGALAALLCDRTGVPAEHVPWRGDHAVPADADIVVNATSIGLYDDAARVPLDTTTLRPGMVVADVIGNPPRTRLIREAEARGCRALDGLGMLVNQGAVAIRFWTGIDPDVTVMRAALERALRL